MRYVICWAVIVLMAMGMLGTTASIGRTKKPTTKGDAVAVITLQVLLIIGMVYLLRTFR